MKNSKLKRCILALLLFVATFCSAPSVSFARDVPAFSGNVVDEANLLTQSDKELLDRALRHLYDGGGSQIAVLTIDSLDGEDIATYSIRVVDQWKLGNAKSDNGALLLVARDDRKIRIEVGQGLEGVLTDLHSKRIIDQVIAPRFRTDEFSRGIVEGVLVIAKFTDPDKDLQLGGMKSRASASNSATSRVPSWLFVGLVLILWFIGATLSSHTRRGSRFRGGGFGGGGFWGGGGGGFGGGGFSGGGGGGFSGGGASGGW